jgi:hypothetical protein
MTRRILAMGLLCAASASGAGAAAAAGEEEQAVLAAQDRRVAATIAADLAALEAVTTADMTYTHSNAVVDSRAELLEGLGSGKYRYRSVAFGERRVRVLGDAAVISGACRVQVVAEGRDLDVRLRFTEVYARDGGAWKMLLWQSTRIP